MKRALNLLLLLFLFSTCYVQYPIPNPNDDGIIEIQFLQVNDVYEIAPLPGDDRGGLARVATLKRELKNKNENTIAIMAGDFLNPSVIGTLDDEDGNSIKGAHMIDVMNKAGIDMVTFGNHEFDLKEKDLQKRLDESEFEWVSSNVLRIDGDRVTPFFKNKSEKRKEKQNFPETIIKTYKDTDGTTVKVGFFGVTLDVKQQPYVAYEDPFARAKLMVEDLRKKVDIIVPITHLEKADDIKLAGMLKGIPLIMGGHDHNNMRLMINQTVIAKADANAKTAYVHTLKFNKKKKEYTVYSELVKIDNTIKEDAGTKMRVNYWNKIAQEDLAKRGFNPDSVIVNLKLDLDGRESTVRGGQCELGSLVVKSMNAATGNRVHAAIVNSGSIRVDDVLKGNLTEYDVVRILPYENKIIMVEMTGTLLKRILESSLDNRGEGAYLQLDGIEIDEASRTFKIANELLQTDENYIIAMSDFLLAGYDFDFLTRETEGILQIKEPNADNDSDLKNDLRKAFIAYMRTFDGF